MNWKQKLASVGLTEENAPTSVKKAIKELQSFEKALAQRVEKLKTASSEDVRQRLQEEVSTLEAGIDDQNEVIVSKIDKWYKNKDKYAEMGKRLQAGRPPKKDKAAAAPPTPSPAPAPAPAPANPAEPEPKKSGGNGWLYALLGIGVVALTLGMVNPFKNE